jgi:hypothetical protein
MFLDIARYGEEEASRPGAPGRDGLAFLGGTWFEALLVNANQDGIAVRAALTERLRRPPPAEATPFPGARDPGSPFFAGNLFFEPAADPLSDEAAKLWDDALAAGWSILVAGAGKGEETVRETIAAEIRTLRARVRDRLFEGAPPASIPESAAQARVPEPALPPREPEAPAAMDDADAAIAGILDGILRKLSDEAAAATAPPPAEPKASPPRPPAAPPASDDFLVKTVVLGAGQGPPRPAGAPLIAADPAPDDAIEKTMILRPGAVTPAPPRTPAPPPAAPPPADDFLDRTVILGPGQSGVVPPAPGAPKAASVPEPPPPADPEAGSDLEKTVIIKAPPDTGKFRRHGR